MKGSRAVAMLLVAVVSSTAWAKPATKNAIGLGFDNLHWRMSVAEARALYPALSPMNSNPNKHPRTVQPALYLDNLRHGACTLAATLFFAGGKLISVDVETAAGGEACKKQIENELGKRYGRPSVDNGPVPPISLLIHREWKGPVTTVFYNYMGGENDIDVLFERTGCPQMKLLFPVECP